MGTKETKSSEMFIKSLETDIKNKSDFQLMTLEA